MPTQFCVLYILGILRIHEFSDFLHTFITERLNLIRKTCQKEGMKYITRMVFF